jgi:hypothetical protein
MDGGISQLIFYGLAIDGVLRLTPISLSDASQMNGTDGLLSMEGN